jgi:hypothetical protein
MGTHDSGIKRGVFVIGVFGQDLEYLLPNSLFRPTGMAGMNHPKIPKTLW